MLDGRIMNVQRVALTDQRRELLELYLKAHRDEIETNENDEYQEVLVEIDLDLLYALLEYDLLLEGFAECSSPDYNEGRM
jgi:succinate dehydrogenase flavin-adding protein (antitoxin of CptAB toxin-antitoxin module)